MVCDGTPMTQDPLAMLLVAAYVAIPLWALLFSDAGILRRKRPD